MRKAQRKSKNQIPKPEDDPWMGEPPAVAAMQLREDNDVSNGKPGKYDLEERTARFGQAIIRFARRVPQSPVNNRLIGQLVGAGTSIGANYCEASDAVSRKDFRNKIGTCRKEAKETKYFLRMIATAEESLQDDARTLWLEAKELHLIFCAIYRKSLHGPEPDTA